MNEEVKISPPAGTCALCGVELSQLSRHPSALKPDLERVDFCPACFRDLENPDFVCLWWARRTQKVSERLRKRTLAEQMHQLFYTLRKSEELRTPAIQLQLYLLAHLLLRLKVFRWDGTREKGGETVLRFYDNRKRKKVEIRKTEIDTEQAGSWLSQILYSFQLAK